MTAYYNEFDQYVADWLENLIYAGHIAPGVVDTRSIEDVRPSDIAGFTQCHFFAGIGIWSLALRSAGWPDNRPVWSGSCPCQPFSAAGKGAAFADERHLWPAFGHLIAQRKPAVIFGEQVASAAVDAWIDLVHADLEAVGYAFGSVPFPSAGVGAPHIRDRNYWVAHASGQGLEKRVGLARVPGGATGRGTRQATIGNSVRDAIGLADAHGSAGGQGGADVRGRAAGGDAQSRAGLGGGGVLDGLGYTNGIYAAQVCASDDTVNQQREEERGRSELAPRVGADGGTSARHSGPGRGSIRVASDVAGMGGPGPTNGFWAAADWLGCRDGKWRPVEPGTFPLAHGAAARVGRLRAYGNAINAEAAKAWIETVMECIP